MKFFHKKSEEKDILYLTETENKIRDMLREISVNTSRLKRTIEDYELYKNRIIRERHRNTDFLLNKYDEKIERCKNGRDDLNETKRDLKDSLEEIKVLKIDFRKEEVYDLKDQIDRIKSRIDEVLSRVEAYEVLMSDVE
jgi:chromosome segregation ATPase